MIQDGTFPDEVTILAQMKEKSITAPSSGLSISMTSIADSWANLNEVYKTYIPLLQLGLVEDIDGWLAEFMKAADTAGLAKVKEEIGRQFTNFMNNN
jgi:putative aldouronate transport system substrate-binding protein